MFAHKRPVVDNAALIHPTRYEPQTPANALGNCVIARSAATRQSPIVAKIATSLRSSQ
ncbi:hypothetical protein AGMMS49545_11740 [Betaproteobacteria bacterium]|nr:hypothetical protein AGMMS49545_11740 [Betaproteobacteria bacterium]